MRRESTVTPNYHAHDKILTFAAGDLIVTRGMIFNGLREEFEYIDVYIDELIGLGLLSTQIIQTAFAQDDNQRIQITTRGLEVIRDGGYVQYKNRQKEHQVKISNKEELELRHLKNAVRLTRWQFWFLILGAGGGAVSFLVMLYQFLFGEGGLINDLFSY